MISVNETCEHQQGIKGKYTFNLNHELSLVHKRTEVVEVLEVMMLKATSVCLTAASLSGSRPCSFPPAAACQLPPCPARIRLLHVASLLFLPAE